MNILDRTTREERRSSLWTLFFGVVALYFAVYLFFGIDRVTQRAIEIRSTVIVK